MDDERKNEGGLGAAVAVGCMVIPLAAMALFGASFFYRYLVSVEAAEAQRAEQKAQAAQAEQRWRAYMKQKETKESATQETEASGQEDK